MLFFSLQQCMGHLFSLHQYCTMVKSVFCIVLYNVIELVSFLSLDNCERITLNELHQTEHLTYNYGSFPSYMSAQGREKLSVKDSYWSFDI